MTQHCYSNGDPIPSREQWDAHRAAMRHLIACVRGYLPEEHKAVPEVFEALYIAERTCDLVSAGDWYKPRSGPVAATARELADRGYDY